MVPIRRFEEVNFSHKQSFLTEPISERADQFGIHNERLDSYKMNFLKDLSIDKIQNLAEDA